MIWFKLSTVRSEHSDEMETMVYIDLPSTSTVTAVTTDTLTACPERSTGVAPSYSKLTKNLKLNQAGIRTDAFTDFQPHGNGAQGQSSVREVNLRQHFQTLFYYNV